MLSVLLAQQLAVLFLIMGCGFVLVKTGLVQSRESRTRPVITLYLIMPCVSLNAFQIDYSDQIRDGLILAFLAGAAIHAVLFALVGLLGRVFRLEAVEKASLIYSNAGNLIIPLVTSVLGPQQVIYASGFLCVQTVFLWTHGQSLMRGTASISWKKLLCNINLLASLAGILLFVTGIHLPLVLEDTLSTLASTIGPVSMLVVGMLLADVSWSQVLARKRIYGIVFLKMIVIPGTVLLLLRAAAPFVPVAGASDILFISLMAVITPSATTITQMAQIYDRGASYASSINVLTTLVCIATMPLMAFFYML